MKTREISYLRQILVQDQEALFEGRYSVREEVSRNINDYLSHGLKYNLGIRTRILVKTGDDHILYPTQYNKDIGETDKGDDSFALPRESLNYTDVAAENFRILNDGLVLSVDVRIKHNGWLSNGILMTYVFLSLWILRVFIRKGLRESEKQETKQRALIEDLSRRLRDTETGIRDVKTKEARFQGRISELKKDKKELSKDVDGLLEEVEKLEVGLKDQSHQKQKMEMEVLKLRDQLNDIKSKSEKPKHKKKKKEAINKRFKLLYKNLDFTNRAIDGFLGLTEEFRLKAEEIIHRINQNASSVSVKRKVFGKGGKLNVLETDFSYSGRIYFQKDSGSKIRIVAIGTKNTQERDLTYLEGMK